jgi:hypothetical protein
MLPVGLIFGLYSVLGLSSTRSALLGADIQSEWAHPAMLAVGGYGLWLIARAVVRLFSAVTPPPVLLPMLPEERREAADQTPEERLLAAVAGSREDGYTPIFYDGRRVELYRPARWVAQRVSKWLVDQPSRIPWDNYYLRQEKVWGLFWASIVSAIIYTVWVLFGRDARRYARIDHRSEIEYRESGGWLWWQVGLFVVAPGLIVLDRVLA